jgi:3D (Asp-Asp-Asp) domain-containing protein
LIGRVLCATFLVAGLVVYPAAASSPRSASPVTGVTWHRDGLLTWERTEHRVIPPQTLHRLSRDLAPGTSRVVARGAPGIIELRVRYAQRDGGAVHRMVLWTQIVKAPHARTVADGIGHSALTDLEAIGITRMASIARGALQIIQMDATAYSAECGGCDGMTAIGRRAGHGIVAVDPRIIPLGTHLYILGYGPAIAGDTGGAIIGHRIDLGFDSQRDALLFGRRAVTVYKLK